MLYLIDTGVLLRLFNPNEPSHAAIRQCLWNLRKQKGEPDDCSDSQVLGLACAATVTQAVRDEERWTFPRSKKEAAEVVRGFSPGNRIVSRTAFRQEVVT